MKSVVFIREVYQIYSLWNNWAVLSDSRGGKKSRTLY